MKTCCLYLQNLIQIDFFVEICFTVFIIFNFLSNSDHHRSLSYSQSVNIFFPAGNDRRCWCFSRQTFQRRTIFWQTFLHRRLFRPTFWRWCGGRGVNNFYLMWRYFCQGMRRGDGHIFSWAEALRGVRIPGFWTILGFGSNLFIVDHNPDVGFSPFGVGPYEEKLNLKPMHKLQTTV